MRRAELDQVKENPEIKQPKPSIFKIISRILVSSLILSILGTVLAASAISYQKVVVAQSYAAQSYADVRHPAEDEGTDKKLMKHGFNQDFIEITNRVEEYDLATAPMKNSKTGKDGVVCDKPSSCSFDDNSAYLVEFITGYGDNHEPITKKKLYQYDSLNPSRVNINYVKSTEQKQPHIKINYEKVEEYQIRLCNLHL